MREEKRNYDLCLIIQNLPPMQSKSAKFWKIVICKITATYSFCNYTGGKDILRAQLVTHQFPEKEHLND